MNLYLYIVVLLNLGIQYVEVKILWNKEKAVFIEIRKLGVYTD